MSKRLLISAFLAGAVALGAGLVGAQAASADDYPPVVGCTASPPTLVVGQTSIITCTGFVPGPVTFSVTGEGVVPGTLSSIVKTVVGTSTVDKTANAEGTVSVAFLAPSVGGFTVSVSAPEQPGRTVDIQVTAPTPTPTPTSTTPGLPPTGGEIPAIALWAGVGVLAAGGIALATATARRRRGDA